MFTEERGGQTAKKIGLGAAGMALLAGGWMVLKGDDPGPSSTVKATSTTVTPLASDAEKYALAYLSKDGSKVTVFLTDGAGKQTKALTVLDGQAEALQWSPDGSSLLFDGDSTGNFDIMTIDISTAKVVNLTSDSTAGEGGASWSPDGSKIVFFSNRGGAFAGYVANRDGTSPLQITPEGQDVSSLVWAPDGDSIAYMVRGDGIESEVWIVGSDGAKARKVADLPGAAMPAFSPDGKTLAVVGQKAGDTNPQPYALNIDSGSIKQLATVKYASLSPSWSPDGRFVYFVTEAPNDEGGGSADDIMRVSIDGGDPESVTGDPIGVEADAVLSSDSHLLAFSIRKLNDREIFVANPDGSGAQPLSRSPREDFSPTWRPTPHG